MAQAVMQAGAAERSDVPCGLIAVLYKEMGKWNAKMRACAPWGVLQELQIAASAGGAVSTLWSHIHRFVEVNRGGGLPQAAAFLGHDLIG
jgi:hypothetical protein